MFKGTCVRTLTVEIVHGIIGSVMCCLYRFSLRAYNIGGRGGCTVSLTMAMLVVCVCMCMHIVLA